MLLAFGATIADIVSRLKCSMGMNVRKLGGQE